MNDIELLFKQHQNSLQAFAQSILRNTEDAQDVVQEVFGACFKNKDITPNKSYLFKAVKNRSLNKIRYKNNFKQLAERFKELVLDSIEPESDFISFEEVITSLPTKYKQVLILRIKSELKNIEIAEVLDIPVGTVKSRINKALKLIKNKVKVDIS